jgi:hypothetical protein
MHNKAVASQGEVLSIHTTVPQGDGFSSSKFLVVPQTASYTPRPTVFVGKLRRVHKKTMLFAAISYARKQFLLFLLKRNVSL